MFTLQKKIEHISIVDNYIVENLTIEKYLDDQIIFIKEFLNENENLKTKTDKRNNNSCTYKKEKLDDNNNKSKELHILNNDGRYSKNDERERQNQKNVSLLNKNEKEENYLV